MLSNSTNNDKVFHLKYNPAIGGTSLPWIELLSTLVVRVYFVMEITQELVKSLFDYRNDGYLIWKVERRFANVKGKVAGSFSIDKKRKRRMCVPVLGKLQKAARIIFLWHHGYLPTIVDHIDRDCENDRIENLRAATTSQNNTNKSKRNNCSSVYTGVYKIKTPYPHRWYASLCIRNKTIFGKCFSTEEEAALAYNREAVRYHGEFANLNIIQPLPEPPKK